jgi:2-methylaconitate cis-trans-isomerase PrpF
VHIWQRNIGQRIVSHVPLDGGVPRESGDFREDGVVFTSAEIVLEFIEEEQRARRCCRPETWWMYCRCRASAPFAPRC